MSVHVIHKAIDAAIVSRGLDCRDGVGSLSPLHRYHCHLIFRMSQVSHRHSSDCLAILTSGYRPPSLTVNSDLGPQRRSPLSDFETASRQLSSGFLAKSWCQFSAKLSRPVLVTKRPCSSSPPSVIASASSSSAHRNYGGLSI